MLIARVAFTISTCAGWRWGPPNHSTASLDEEHWNCLIPRHVVPRSSEFIRVSIGFPMANVSSDLSEAAQDQLFVGSIEWHYEKPFCQQLCFDRIDLSSCSGPVPSTM